MNVFRHTMFSFCLVVLPFALLPGCATYMSAGEIFRARQVGLEVSLPNGWLRFRPAQPVHLVTRDGLRLESIAIKNTPVGAKIAGTERVFSANMLPHEIAELSLGLLKVQEGTKNFEEVSIDLATVAAHEGFVAEARYVDAQGLRKRMRMYGAMIADHVCEFAYDAAESVYYERYLPEFEKVVASARLVDR